MAENENTRKRSGHSDGRTQTVRRTTSGASRSNLKKNAGHNVRRKKGNAYMIPEPKTIIIVATVIVLLLVVIGVRSCGVRNRNGESVAAELVKAGVEGKMSQMKKCYGVKGDVDTSLQTELDSYVSYYQAHEAKGVKINATDTLFEEGDYVYVYVIYHLVLEDDQEYPCVKTFMTQKKDKRFYVMPSSEITSELSKKAEEAYTKFMTTDNYKNYTKDYETFLKRNPGYENLISEKLN